MTKPTIQIGDVAREMTDAENDQYNLDLAEWQAQAKADKAKAKQKQIVLDRLGITAAEAQLLLG